jgi:hypothetical protein
LGYVDLEFEKGSILEICPAKSNCENREGDYTLGEFSSQVKRMENTLIWETHGRKTVKTGINKESYAMTAEQIRCLVRE